MLVILALSPWADAEDGQRVYFGDLHIHTRYSLDALVFGTRTGPADAYRFARGEPITLPGGRRYQLKRPLDFAAVTDHAFGLGEYALCTDEASRHFDEPLCRDLRSGLDPTALRPLLSGRTARPPTRNVRICGPDGAACREAAIGPWQDIQRSAAAFNQPGVFSTFVGFEWTPADRHGRTVHRNVIFRGADVPERALSVFELPLSQNLWEWLADVCAAPCEAMTIPHNANFSGGLMFAPSNEIGEPYSESQWRLRAAFDRLVEIIQVKGSSECAAGIGTTDEECGFEQTVGVCRPDGPARCAAPNTFVRDGLKSGLQLAESLGFNPMQFGLIGSTDTHSAAAGGVEEARYASHHAGLDADAASLLDRRIPTGESIVNFNPGGLAAVWSTENSRDALFAAMRSRHTYATSGTRIQLRFATREGATMGSVIQATSAPAFRVAAMRDPDSAPLAKIQIVKGWMDERGNVHEQVWDIACGGRAEQAPAPGCATLPASVDLETCDIDEGVGRPSLQAEWEDPAFNEQQPAFYYVRVIEAPTCRWTTVLANEAGIEPPAGVSRTVAERAWSSPIWHEPRRAAE